MTVKRVVSSAANRVLALAGVELVAAWRYRKMLADCRRYPRFSFGGRDVPYFFHHHNVGQHPATATERTVELALADYWLGNVPADRVVEVGAVTPYYWPGRVRRVVDPVDPHPAVTDRCTMADVDLTGQHVLCVSTLEHVGSSDYGLVPDPGLLRSALQQITTQPSAFLATVPVGCNKGIDEWVFGGGLPAGVRARFLVRKTDLWTWQQVGADEAAKVPYGDTMADAIAVIDRGPVLADL